MPIQIALKQIWRYDEGKIARAFSNKAGNCENKEFFGKQKRLRTEALMYTHCVAG